MIGVTTPCRCNDRDALFLLSLLVSFVLKRGQRKGWAMTLIQGVFGGDYHVAVCCT